MTTTIYVGSSEGHPLGLFGPELVPLSMSLRQHHQESENDFSKQYMSCPALLASIKNTFVVPSPVDIRFFVQDNKLPGIEVLGSEVSPLFLAPRHTGANSGGPSFVSLQFLHDSFLVVVADRPTNIWVTPPYLHSSKLYGFSGTYDISKWVRPLGFVAEVREEFIVRRGEPLCYFRFETKERIKLVKSTLRSDFFSLMAPMSEARHVAPKSSLAKLYDLAFRAGRIKAIVNYLKNNQIR